MNRVLVSLAVVLAVSAVASAQPWLDARDLNGSTPGGMVWELMPNTTTWIALHGDSAGQLVETLMGPEIIVDPGTNAGPAPTFTGVWTYAGSAFATYLFDMTTVAPNQIYWSIAQFSGAMVPAVNQPVGFVEINTAGCLPSDWYDLDITTSDMYGPMVTPLGCMLTNGQIHIVPEPGTITLLVMGAAGLVLRRRRK